MLHGIHDEAPLQPTQKEQQQRRCQQSKCDVHLDALARRSRPYLGHTHLICCSFLYFTRVHIRLSSLGCPTGIYSYTPLYLHFFSDVRSVTVISECASRASKRNFSSRLNGSWSGQSCCFSAASSAGFDGLLDLIATR